MRLTEKDRWPAGPIVPGRYWHPLDDGRIQCDVCPHFCTLREGQQGLCFVRARQEDQIVLTTYGRSSGFCVDPIEKKPLHHFLPGTPVLSFGTAGCNLSCKFCQNWDISKSREIEKLSDQASPGEIAVAARELGCRSVAFTYNDPTIFFEYAIDVARACHEVGVKTVAVTAGYICPEPREELYRHVDAANVDLKAFTERFYAKECGAHLQPVLDTLTKMKQLGVWLEVTTLLIPGLNDDPQELTELAQFLVALGADTPWHISRFHPTYRMMDRPITPLKTLHMAREIGVNAGLHYVYTGNVPGDAGENTACHQCGARLIERFGFSIKRHALIDGKCSQCGTTAAGVAMQ